MREIKFRAWNSKKKEWLLGYEHPNLGGFSLFGECMLGGEWSCILNEHLLNLNGYNIDDLVIMQYTGLKDCKGVEIYEGDVVKHSMVFYGTDYKQVLYYHNGFYLDGYQKYAGGGFPSMEYGESVEVIGNVYENPELMEGVKDE